MNKSTLQGGSKNKPRTPIEEYSLAASILSLTEIGLGSFLHGFKIPFSGHFLSMNQGLILAKTTRAIKGSFFATSQISLIASLLKTLAPAGKKLTPMLAISMQGILFNFGTLALGNNFFGIWLGFSLLALWAFIQPILIYIILFGKDLIYMANYFLSKIEKVFHISIEDIWIIFIYLILFKLTLALVGTILIFKLPGEKIELWNDLLVKKSIPKRKLLKNDFQQTSLKESVILSLKDLFNPLFIVTWIFTIIFFYFSKSPHTPYIWIILRPVAIGFLIFLAIRILPIEKLCLLLEKIGLQQFSKILKSSIDKLKQL